MAVIIWLISTIVLNLQLKKTIEKYGSDVHNKIKPLIVALITIPLITNAGSVTFSFPIVVLTILSLLMVSTYSTIYNKMVETTPMYIMNAIIIISSLESFLIDGLVGKIGITTYAIMSLTIKTYGLYLLIIKANKSESDTQKLQRGKVAVIIILSAISVARLYLINIIMESETPPKEYYAILTQLSISLFAWIKYRNKKLNVKPLEFIKDYWSQILITIVSDMTYFGVIAKGVNRSIDFQIIILISLLLIETKLKPNKYHKMGMFIIMTTILLNTIIK